MKDWTNGNSQAIDPGAPQYGQAINLAQELKAKLGDQFTDITGQSLGGGLAAASMCTGVRATTFNAAGLNPATVAVHGGQWDESNITNFRVEGDPLTEAQEGHAGTDPVTDYVTSHHGGWGAKFLGEISGAVHDNLPIEGPQVSYITGPMAELLPDAAGTQIDIMAIDAKGNRMSREEQMNMSNWQYLHHSPGIKHSLLM